MMSPKTKRIYEWVAVAVILVLIVWLLGACTTLVQADGTRTTSLLGIPLTRENPDGSTDPLWVKMVAVGLGAPPLMSLLGKRGWQNAGKLAKGLYGAVSGAVTLDKQKVAESAKAATRATGALYGVAHTHKPEPAPVEG